MRHRERRCRMIDPRHSRWTCAAFAEPWLARSARVLRGPCSERQRRRFACSSGSLRCVRVRIRSVAQPSTEATGRPSSRYTHAGAATPALTRRRRGPLSIAVASGNATNRYSSISPPTSSLMASSWRSVNVPQSNRNRTPPGRWASGAGSRRRRAGLARPRVRTPRGSRADRPPTVTPRRGRSDRQGSSSPSCSWVSESAGDCPRRRSTRRPMPGSAGPHLEPLR